jgi:hypothetical protein
VQDAKLQETREQLEATASKLQETETQLEITRQEQEKLEYEQEMKRLDQEKIALEYQQREIAFTAMQLQTVNALPQESETASEHDDENYMGMGLSLKKIMFWGKKCWIANLNQMFLLPQYTGT